MKGIRYSDATINYALYLAAIAGGESKVDKLNNLNILRLPSGKSLKLKKYKFNFKPGYSKELYKSIVASNDKYRKAQNVKVDRHWGFILDEMYLKGNLVYRASDMKLLGVCCELTDDNFIQPIITALNHIDESNNYDCTKAVLQQYKSKLVLQTIIVDYTCKWQLCGPYWLLNETRDQNVLFNCIIEDLMFQFWQSFKIPFYVMILDMSTINKSFVLSLTDMNTRQLSKQAIDIDIWFYEDIQIIVF